MAIPCETICPTLPFSSFLLVLNTFSHFLARQRSEKEATVLSNIPRTKMAGNAKVRSSVSLSLSLLLLARAPKKKGEKEIVGIVWIEYSAGI